MRVYERALILTLCSLWARACVRAWLHVSHRGVFVHSWDCCSDQNNTLHCSRLTWLCTAWKSKVSACSFYISLVIIDGIKHNLYHVLSHFVIFSPSLTHTQMHMRAHTRTHMHWFHPYTYLNATLRRVQEARQALCSLTPTNLGLHCRAGKVLQSPSRNTIHTCVFVGAHVCQRDYLCVCSGGVDWGDSQKTVTMATKTKISVCITPHS